MRNKTKVIFALIVGIFTYSTSIAQNAQSAYSVFGIGDINYGGYSHNTAMGGLGVSYNSRFFLNNINPALGASNLEAVFQIGSAMDIRDITDGNSTYVRTTGGLKDLGFNAPVVLGRWNIGLSLQPYTNVGYGFTINAPGPDGSTAVTEVTGAGGIDQVSLNNAVKLGNLLLGLRLEYLFGSIQEEDRFFLEGVQETAFGTSVVDGNATFGVLTGSVGAVYKAPLGNMKYLNLGGYYHPEFELNQKTFITLENQTTGGNGVFSTDTLVDNAKSKLFIPARFGFGATFEKSQKLAFGIDFHLQDWSDYKRLDGQPEDNLGQSYRIAVGGELLPDYQSVKFGQRLTYRFGVHYEQTPYLIDNTPVNDFGISFGASVPLNAVWGLSHLTLGGEVGQRGKTSGNMVRENYIKVYLGFSLQDVTWFARTRFN